MLSLNIKKNLQQIGQLLHPCLPLSVLIEAVNTLVSLVARLKADNFCRSFLRNKGKIEFTLLFSQLKRASQYMRGTCAEQMSSHIIPL